MTTPVLNPGVGGVPRVAVERAEEFADLGPDTWLVSEGGIDQSDRPQAEVRAG